jgi:hypothetical protein
MLFVSHCYETLFRMELVTKIDYGKLLISVVYMDFFNNANIIIPMVDVPIFLVE